MALTLKTMRYFVVALQHGNISKAASEVNVAASAVAAALDQVEAHFGLMLTVRQRSRGIVATANGRAIMQKFQRVLDEYDAILLEGTDLKHSVTGTLGVGYYAPIAPAFLPHILQSSGLSDGDVTFHLEECDNEVAQDGLISGRFDAILFVSNGARPGVDYEPLIDAPAYCLVPAGHPLAGSVSLTLRQISEHPLVFLDRPFATEYYQKLFAARGITPSIVAHASSTEMVRSLVGSGMGCAVLNMVPLTNSTYAGDEVVAVPISDALSSLNLAVGYSKSAPRRLVKAFAEACVAHFAEPGRHNCIVPNEP